MINCINSVLANSSIVAICLYITLGRFGNICYAAIYVPLVSIIQKQRTSLIVSLFQFNV